ncbi:hypothetical protein P168DRAFT_59867 [Aspergillus campestris IBT 28561]|uniref:Uncharacterized protein n=1 Tax=Aspergillus campestris (strain IBT 28561) TaxID=1392248 RepID=A0A2I1CUA9_ASPC2|nr:uncharacterized protein P168DRAFT_59867 [Aspergillus campestris IBT 28561]PKY01201.1 hypothetical protein P168DRAFT_59867 [Aspergillus campestris IBT 28561]
MLFYRTLHSPPVPCQARPKLCPVQDFPHRTHYRMWVVQPRSHLSWDGITIVARLPDTYSLALPPLVLLLSFAIWTTALRLNEVRAAPPEVDRWRAPIVVAWAGPF